MYAARVDHVQVTGISNIAGMGLKGEGINTQMALAIVTLSDQPQLKHFNLRDITTGLGRLAPRDSLAFLHVEKSDLGAPPVNGHKPSKGPRGRG